VLISPPTNVYALISQVSYTLTGSMTMGKLSSQRASATWRAVLNVLAMRKKSSPPPRMPGRAG